MPTYEFRCPLGHEFERFYRSIGTSEAQTACPECGQLSERFMSVGAGLVFKGSGFYLTDYGKNAHQQKAPSDAKAESGPSDGAKGDGAKGDGAKGDGSKSESGSSGAGDSTSARASSDGDGKKSDGKKSDAKAESKSESKPAAPKPSAGE